MMLKKVIRALVVTNANSSDIAVIVESVVIKVVTVILENRKSEQNSTAGVEDAVESVKRKDISL